MATAKTKAKTTREILRFDVDSATKLELTPVNENGMYQAMTADVARGKLVELVTKPEQEPVEITTNRFKVDVAGKTEYGTTIDKALGKMFAIDEFTYDATSAFFTEAFRANKPESDVVEARDDWEELKAVRVEAEAAIIDAYENNENAQQARIRLADILTGVQAKLGSAKAMAAWARGGKEENTELMGAAPLLTKLGNGKNALSEAMRWSKLTEDQKTIVPASITSGKGVDKFLRDSLNSVMDAIGSNLYGEHGYNCIADKDHNGNSTVTEAAFVEAVDTFLSWAGVADSDYGTMSEGIEACKLLIEPALKAYEVSNGKHDDSDMGREHALSVMGLVYGLDLVEAAVKAEKDWCAFLERDEDKQDEGNMKALQKQRNSALFVKRVNQAITAAANEDAADKRERAAIKAAADAGDFGSKVKADESAETIAARFWNTINGAKTTPAKRDKIMETLAMLHREQKRHERETTAQAAE